MCIYKFELENSEILEITIVIYALEVNLLFNTVVYYIVKEERYINVTIGQIKNLIQFQGLNFIKIYLYYIFYFFL